MLLTRQMIPQHVESEAFSTCFTDHHSECGVVVEIVRDFFDHSGLNAVLPRELRVWLININRKQVVVDRVSLLHPTHIIY